MILVVDPHSGLPVYRQIMEQIRFHVASGLVAPGDEIPSTRALSKQLGVNPMTVSKAFSMLEEEGVLERRPGLPHVVRRRRADRMRATKLEQLEKTLRPVVTKARQLGLEPEEAAAAFRRLLESEERGLMEYPFEASQLTKRFETTVALDGVDVRVSPRSIVGLLGKNGSGKTTLMRHLMGLLLPSEGQASTLGRPTSQLGHDELIRIGFVPQEIRLLDWMTVEQHLHYVSTFYPRWDRERQSRLLEELELDPSARTGSLSTGNLQKLAVIR